MENWQKKHITANLPKLVEDTNCNEMFLALLLGAGILAGPDTNALDSHLNVDRKTFEFYKLIQSRTNAYPNLIEALRETGQTGAANILYSGYELNGQQPPPLTPQTQQSEISSVTETDSASKTATVGTQCLPPMVTLRPALRRPVTTTPTPSTSEGQSGGEAQTYFS